MAGMAPLLEARGLVKRLGGRLVIDGVDLLCHAGQVVGLLGPNGAGKTTTLRMLYGFLAADAGAIRFEGADVSRDVGRFKRQLGICTQEDTFDGDFTVRENLAIAASYFRPRPRRRWSRSRCFSRSASGSAHTCPPGSSGTAAASGTWTSSHPACSPTRHS
jgi:ABC-type multidrug transport system ATPase subunit